LCESVQSHRPNQQYSAAVINAPQELGVPQKKVAHYVGLSGLSSTIAPIAEETIASRTLLED
jgi:hypothetical protein